MSTALIQSIFRWSLSGRGLAELPNIRSNDTESWETCVLALVELKRMAVRVVKQGRKFL
jgi:hypothetical protein